MIILFSSIIQIREATVPLVYVNEIIVTGNDPVKREILKFKFLRDFEMKAVKNLK